MKTNNLRNLVRMTIPVLALVLSSVFYTACDEGDESAPQPPVEVPKRHAIDLNGISSLRSKIPDIQAKADVTRDTILIGLSNHLAIESADFPSLGKLSDLLQKPNVKMDWHGNGLYPNESKLILSAENAKILSGLHKKGAMILFNPDTKAMFWLNASDENEFDANTLRFMGRTGARDFIISNSDDLESVAKEALVHASAGERSMIRIEDVKISSEKTYHIKGLTDNKNVSFYPDSKLSVIADRHPTPASHLNALYDWPGAEISLIINKNPKALGMENHILANDSTFNILTTPATSTKKTGFLKTYDETGRFVDPIIGTYLIDTYVDRYDIDKPAPGMAVDGIPVCEMEIKKLVYGVYGDENGSGYMMDASVRKIADITKNNLVFFYPALGDGIEMVLSKEAKYNHNYKMDYMTRAYPAVNLSLYEMHKNVVTNEPSFFQKTIHDATSNRKHIYFSGNGIAILVTDQDFRNRWGFGITGNSLQDANQSVKEKLTKGMNIDVPDGQSVIYLTEGLLKNEVLPLSLYKGH